MSFDRPDSSSRPEHVSESSAYTPQPSSDVRHPEYDPTWAPKSWTDEATTSMTETSEQADGESAMRPAIGGQADTARQKRDRSSRATSGGFLLQAMPSASHRKQYGSTRSQKPATQKAEAAARLSRDGITQFNRDGTTDSASSPANVNAAEDIHIQKRRKFKGKEKMESTPAPSQTSSTVAGSFHSANPSTENEDPQDETQQNNSQSAIVDPSAIVRMALSLNESRRLNLAPGRLASNPSPVGRRSTSGRFDVPPNALQGHFGDHRQSLRRSMQSREPSRNGSPTFGGSGGQLPRAASSGWSVPQPNGSPQAPVFKQDTGYTFSSGTLSRAEKARQFIQLHHEYRRLLQVLPPLSPVTASARNSDLGRVYNPLQYIRNRKIRGRERGLLNPEAAGWDDTNDVKTWVDSIEEESEMQGYRAGDIVMLPTWNRSAEKSSEACPESSTADITGNAASGSKPKRPKLEWTFSPSDLLADAYWLEQDVHKTLIETRDGNKIFTRMQRPENLGAPDATRLSYESIGDNRESYPDLPDTDLNSSPNSTRARDRNVPADLVYGANTLPHHEGNLARVKRRLLTRRRTVSTTASLSSGSDDDDVNSPRSGKAGFGHKIGVNTGPLERHMSAMLKIESPRDGNRESSSPNVTKREEGQRRRGGVSKENEQAESHPATPARLRAGSQDYASLRSSLSTDHLGSPRISVEDVDGARTYVNERGWSPSEGMSKGTLDVAQPTAKPKSKPLDIFHRRGKSKQQNNIDENDFAVSANDASRDMQAMSPASARSSLDSGARLNYSKSGTTLEVPRSDSRSQNQDKIHSHDERIDGTAPSTRFFKGGRIGDIVRSERSHGAGSIRKQDAPRKDSLASSKNGAGRTDSSSGNDDELHLTSNGLEPRRSQSTNDLTELPSYHVKNLPTFRSANAPPLPEEEQQTSNLEEDHIYRQLREQRDQKRMRHSRYDNIALPSLDTSTDVSPNTSSYDLTQDARTNDSLVTAQSSIHSTLNSASAVRNADQRLQRLLREPGGVGKGGLPVTGLSKIDAKPSKHSHLAESHRPWSLSEAETPEKPPTEEVTTKEVNHVRALLLSSGVKAHSIVLRANTIVDPPSEYLTKAAKTAGATFSPVSRRQEHVIAARLLSNSLENGASSFEKAAADFRTDTCHKLQARIDDLRERVNADLTPRVRSCGDDADAFIARLTTSHTLAVKQVNDSVDALMRSRWRRLRLLQRAGFKMLEWVVVALMWGIWLFVFVFKAIRGLVVGVVRGGRWLFWM